MLTDNSHVIVPKARKGTKNRIKSKKVYVSLSVSAVEYDDENIYITNNGGDYSSYGTSNFYSFTKGWIPETVAVIPRTGDKKYTVLVNDRSFELNNIISSYLDVQTITKYSYTKINDIGVLAVYTKYDDFPLSICIRANYGEISVERLSEYDICFALIGVKKTYGKYNNSCYTIDFRGDLSRDYTVLCNHINTKTNLKVKKYKAANNIINDFLNKKVKIIQFDGTKFWIANKRYCFNIGIHVLSTPDKTIASLIVDNLMKDDLRIHLNAGIVLKTYIYYTHVRYPDCKLYLNDIPIKYTIKNAFHYINDIRVNKDDISQALIGTKTMDKNDYTEYLKSLSGICLTLKNMIDNGVDIRFRLTNDNVKAAKFGFEGQYDFDYVIQNTTTGYNFTSNDDNVYIKAKLAKKRGQLTKVDLLGKTYTVRGGTTTARLQDYLSSSNVYLRSNVAIKYWLPDFLAANMFRYLYPDSDSRSWEISRNIKLWLYTAYKFSLIFKEDVVLFCPIAKIKNKSIDRVRFENSIVDGKCADKDIKELIEECSKGYIEFNKTVSDTANKQSDELISAFKRSENLLNKVAAKYSLEPIVSPSDENKIVGYKVIGASNITYHVTILGGVYTSTPNVHRPFSGNYICIDPVKGHNNSNLPGFDYTINILMVLLRDVKLYKNIWTLKDYLKREGIVEN